MPLGIMGGAPNGVGNIGAPGKGDCEIFERWNAWLKFGLYTVVGAVDVAAPFSGLALKHQINN